MRLEGAGARARARPAGGDDDVGSVAGGRRDLLDTVGSNLELLRLDRGKSRDEVREYARRWSPQPAERIEKTLDWIDNPALRGYIHCYPEGLRLGREFVRGDPARFKQLLTGHFVPEDLGA